MSEYIFWAFSYVTLFITLIWVQMILVKDAKARKSSRNPLITIAVPVYNEEKGVGRTLESLFNLNYPKDKLQIIAVNHGSTDNSLEILRKYENKITIINLHRKAGDTKATAVNKALEIAEGEFFVEIDSDTTIENKDALLYLLPHFDDETVGTVINGIRVREPETIIEKIQWFEYLMTTLVRSLMSMMNMLIFTHGVFCMSRTKILKKIGGFAENNFTEDLELGLKMIYNNYKVKMEVKNYGLTSVPKTFMSLLDQRVRWYRGFMQNMIKYKTMMFKRKYGLAGTFSMPVGVLSVLMLFTAMTLLFGKIAVKAYNFMYNIVLLHSDVFFLWKVPSLHDFLLGANWKFLLPFVITMASVIYLFYKAHKLTNEKFRSPGVFATYLVTYPFIVSLQWASALYKHLTDRKVQWSLKKK